ncbi:MAG: 7-carboxy-7-deazaguanine synthase QueE [Planctomycetota bacterium]
MKTALYEVFSSVQGEATRVGERHLFVRLAGCDLECVFCDTPASHRIPDEARLFLPDGTETAPNPLSVETLDAWVTRLDEAAGPHHAISITGGEPLLFVDFLRAVLPRWERFPILLETGGHRPDELARVLDLVDIVMMDVKLPSSAGFAPDVDVTRRFLEIARSKERAVKLVCNARTTADEIESVARLLRDEPLILQPVSGARFEPPTGGHMLALQRAAMRHHRDTRVIPQTHRLLHVR